MSTTQNSSINIKYSGAYNHTNTPVASSAPTMNADQTIPNGIAAGQADEILDLSGSIAASGSTTINILTAVSAFGAVLAPARVKGMIFKNTSSSTTDAHLKIMGETGMGSNGWFAAWGVATGYSVAYVGGIPVMFYNPSSSDSAWVLDATHKSITIFNLSSTSAATWTLQLICCSV